jgi:hypothetical protein
MTTEFDLKSPEELNDENKRQIQDFADVLDSISSLEDKQKALWKNIYSNAITDRSNAYLCFSDLYMKVHGNSNEHAIHGQTITKYLERMSKANDQLIKLADLISRKKEEDNYIDGEDVYETIEKKEVIDPFSRRKKH